MDGTGHRLQVIDALDSKFPPPSVAQEQLGFGQVRGQDSRLREQPGSESMQSIRREKLGTSCGDHYLARFFMSEEPQGQEGARKTQRRNRVYKVPYRIKDQSRDLMLLQSTGNSIDRVRRTQHPLPRELA